ncbi:MAG: N-formylglutamate amidohydrolase [Candidatus Moranbacteria bacterium]|nr:N-formylglutamate amidohydrolase [Candidatus Moranbacteria bacterium]MBP7696082.1 N-formylglutamate amidohydrolase [Candidatus Moranbacteria bacterium]
MSASESGIKISNRDFSMVLSHQYPAKVIISVPHDGSIRDDFSGIFRRSSGVTVRDMHVWLIVNDIIQRCLRFGTRVDATRFLMARTYVDVNRERLGEPNLCPDTLGQAAFDDPDLETVYGHYHSELVRLLDASVREYGAENVLFLDMHGFSKQPLSVHGQVAQNRIDENPIYASYDLILGTANRTTINHGEIDRQFEDFMTRKSYAVFLPKEKPISPEGDPYSAGHITRLYAKKYRINAIQVEIDARFRRSEQAREAGEKLAWDMAEFLSEHYA